MEFQGHAGGSCGISAAAPHPLVPRLLALAIVLAKGKIIDLGMDGPYSTHSHCTSAFAQQYVACLLSLDTQLQLEEMMCFFFLENRIACTAWSILRMLCL